MSSSESTSELVIELAEEFIDRYRKGERPPLKEYIDRYPDLASEIKEVFPAMAMMENIAVDDSMADDRTSKVAKPAPVTLKQLGDYRIIREIGRGGMGFVYEAEQVSLGRHVALKLLPNHALHDDKQKRRFEREARAAAKLHHTNIVPVFGIGDHDGVPYYVMQFIQGLGLDAVLDELNRLQTGAAPTPTGLPTVGEIRVSRRDVSAADAARSLLTGEFQQLTDSDEAADLKPRPEFAATEEFPRDGSPQENAPSPETSGSGRLSDSFTVSSSSVTLPGTSGTGRKSSTRKQTYWQSVANIGLQVADALEYAHQQGIQHRDVKPSNLLLDMRGTIWVTDFGLAKVAGPDAEDLTHTGDILGTLRYMPPEAFEGRSDARGDVYSLGMTLYELLAMRPAFDEKDRKKLIKQVTLGEPTPLDKVRREIPRDLVTIVQKSIAREPSRRYASAEDLATDLQRFLDDEPIQARRQTHLERFVRWARHHPSIAVLGGVLTAVLVLVTVASLLAAGYFNQLRWNETRAALNERVARQEADQSRQAESSQRERAENEKLRADDEAQSARKAKQEAEDRAKAEAAANALAQREKLRADENAKKADENAKKAEERAGAARKAEEEAKVQLTRAEWLVYAGKLSLAQTDFETGNGALARQYLDDCQWNLRGWEHRYLWTRINAKLSLAHAGAVCNAAFSSDGKRLLTGNWGDATAKVWDAETGRELLILRHGTAIRNVAFSPDNKRIVTGAGDVNRPSEAKVWDAATGRELLTLKGHTGWVWSVAFSPDNKRIVTGAFDGEPRVWDAETGQELFTLKGHKDRVWCVVFSPDGKRIVSASSDSTVKVWDAETGLELRTLKGHTGEVRSVAFSSDGKHLVTGSSDRKAEVWKIETGEDILTLNGHTDGVLGVAFSPDDKRIVSASADATVRVWNAATGQEILALKGHAGQVHSAAFSPDGKHIVSACDDGTAKVWDAERGQKVLTLNGQNGPVRSVAFSPDSQRIVSAGRVWDSTTGREFVALKGAAPARGVAFSPDGRRIVTGGPDNTGKVWDAVTGQELFTLKGHPGPVMGLAFSPDGKRIVIGSGDGYSPGGAKVWDAETGQEVFTLKGRVRIWSVAFSADGKRIVTGDGDVYKPGKVKVWDAATGQEVMEINGHSNEVWSVAFSADGKRIVTGCLDKAVRVFDAETGKIVHTLSGHTMGVWSVAFSPDGKRIFSGSEDRTVRVWDAGKGQELLALKGDSSVFGVAFSPDGKRLAAGSEDGIVRVWVAEKGQPPRNNEERAELLKDRLPSLLREEDKPADNAERLILAQFAFDHKKFRFATRLWAEALASDPKLGDDRETQPRYNAARAAALAVAGQGKDVAHLDDAAKAKLRGQALDWLKVELTFRAKLLDSAPMQDQLTMLFKLNGWKYDRDLGGIRDAASLAVLPPAEQTALNLLWIDLASLLKTGYAKYGAVLQEQLPESRKKLPKDSPELAGLLVLIGRTFMVREKWAEAEPFIRECLAIRETNQPDSWLTFNAQSMLGGALLGQKKYAEAEPLLLKGYHGMKERETSIPSIGRDRLPEAIDRLIDLYTATNKPDEVKKWRAEQAKISDAAPLPVGKK